MPPATISTPLLVDNDVFTHWRNERDYVKQAITEYYNYHQRFPALASVTAFEALSGFRRDTGGNIESGLGEKFARAQSLIRGLEVLPLDLAAAEIAASVFRRLPSNRRAKLGNDLFIPATALANACGVATGNRRDFELIESLFPRTLGPLYLAIWK
jgi:predicted nucleic acid-binding protein